MSKDVLENVTQSPCLYGWENMDGDERVRFCQSCKMNVFNLGDMTKKEAESTIEQSGGKLCVRIYRRKDGSVYTDNCPRQLRSLRNQIRVVAPFALVFFSWFFLQTPSDAQGLVGAPVNGGYHRSYPSEELPPPSVLPAITLQGLLVLILSYTAGLARIRSTIKQMTIWSKFGASQRVRQLFITRAVTRNLVLFAVVPTLIAFALYFFLLHNPQLSIIAGY